MSGKIIRDKAASFEKLRSDRLDVTACRKERPYRASEYLGRMLWSLATPLFRLSPRSFFGWRRFLLRAFGAQIGREAHVYPSVHIYLPWMLTLGEQASIGEWSLIYNLGPVTIGERATISHRAHLCAGTHDYRDPVLPLQRLPIEIGAQAWVCADAFVGPGRRVGEGAIVGAAAVVMSDVPDWQIVAGNPARVIKQRVLRCSGEATRRPQQNDF
ncbi:putative colanic acid biosynthesis acetyltransferase [Lamprobacter modestohalophilus]|uniref:putative colanic acid biosynthesis acetyltransferase n=1 Tax=Lamprobacter modestohalophilus TaxID=1064514 RepID=UPI002ADEA751|nr:putative colanic acid biosynthesis acetyltransferase [Lamprobacter modestohalophilus]MEA1049018.1 putative colanic acid biosynthesis acetyltransferase [Lamprobacter modestohalophilus]